jgi:hypothetical protein
MPGIKYVDNDYWNFSKPIVENLWFGYTNSTNGITIPTTPQEGGLIGISIKLNGVSCQGVLDTGSRKVTTNPTDAEKIGLKNFPSSIEKSEILSGPHKGTFQQITKYHLPSLEVVGVGIFPVAVNVRDVPGITLIPSGLLREYYTLELGPGRRVGLTDKIENVGERYAKNISEDYNIPNHIVSVGGHSFPAIFDSGAGNTSVTHEVASIIGLKQYPHDAGSNEGEGYRVHLNIGPYIIPDARVDILDAAYCIVSLTDLMSRGWTIRLHENSTEFAPGGTF